MGRSAHHLGETLVGPLLPRRPISALTWAREWLWPGKRLRVFHMSDGVSYRCHAVLEVESLGCLRIISDINVCRASSMADPLVVAFGCPFGR